MHSSIHNAPEVPLRKLLACLLVANFITAGSGMPLPGLAKLSISNLMPMLFMSACGVLFLSSRESVPQKTILFLGLFNVSAMTSFLIFLVRDQWSPNLIVLLFQNVELLFCVLLYWYERNDPTGFRNAVKIGLYMAAPVAICYGIQEIRAHITLPKFGMDDKSHAAILLSMASFLFLRFFPSGISKVVALLLLVMAALTVSRLPVLFIPAILFALMAGAKHRVVILLCGGIGLALLLGAYGSTFSDTFAVTQRLSSIDAISGEDSTLSHLKLLETAWSIKTSDSWHFFFGIGPSNFSKALVSAPDALDRIGATDPALAVAALQDIAPVHSTQFAIFLDYGIWIFVLYLFFLLKAIHFLWTKGKYTDLLFGGAIFASSIFYTLHNKPYFFLYLTCYALLLKREDSHSRRHEFDKTLREHNELAPA